MAAIKATTLSARDRLRKAEALYAESRKAFEALKTSSIDDRVVALNNLIKDKEIEIKAGQVLVSSNANDAGVTLADKNTAEAALRADKVELDKLKDQRSQLAMESTVSKGLAQISAENSAALAAAVIRATPLGTYATTTGKGTSTLQYNASGIRSGYFNPNQFRDMNLQNNNPAAVASADALWSTSSGSKGMIVMSEQVLKSINSGSNAPQTSNYYDNNNYGFQFQYNPGTVSMNYFTSPNVDVTMMTSGTEMFNLAGVSGSQGSVSFQVIINRTFDMQYYTSAGTLKSGYDIASIYSKPPAPSEYKDIVNKGTMYDVEYLLRVLMGTTLNSYLRGQKTADMGWLPAIPVELHLGKSLRYLGTVNSVNLNHIIFSEKMVPLFTTVDIQFTRLPDYPAVSSSATGSGSGGDLGGAGNITPASEV